MYELGAQPEMRLSVFSEQRVLSRSAELAEMNYCAIAKAIVSQRETVTGMLTLSLLTVTRELVFANKSVTV